MKSPRLAAAGVTCGYGDAPVLEDFDLRAAAGTVTVLLGANGAGKSTALRALARLLRPLRGQVTLDGDDVWRLPHRQFARRVAFVPQSDATTWSLTVEQVVLLGRIPHRGWLRPFGADDRAALAAALQQVDLEAFRHRGLDTLSGGERRRAMIARALAQDARILLLDEPGAHLDLRHQVELFERLHALARDKGVAVVLSLHDLNLASLFADQVVLLSRGRIVAQGPPDEVLSPELLRETFELEVATLPHPRWPARLVVPVPRGLQRERP